MKGLLRYALAICLLIGTGLDSLARPSPRSEVETAQILLPVELNVPVTWKACGDWNAFYYFAGYIELCIENLEHGVGVARFIFLHELGHAFTFKHNMTYERWGGNYEAAADEFAAIMSIVQGHPEDLLAIAKLYADEGRLRPHDPDDPHPPLTKRAQTMAKIYSDFDTYREVLAYWGARFQEVN